MYEVSNKGRVRRLGGTPSCKYDRILKPNTLSGGYLGVVLWKTNCKPKGFFIHRLVAITFIDNPNNFSEINHKDEVKTNNNADNLEWCTRKYNCNHGTIKQKISKALSKPVKQYTLDWNIVKIWKSMTEATRNGFYASEIRKCCWSDNRTYKGFHWRFA